MSHTKDLEFHVEIPGQQTRIYLAWAEACGMAIMLACSNGQDVMIDVVTWTREAAIAYAGDYGAEVYDDDPEASVHERITVKASSMGRVA